MIAAAFRSVARTVVDFALPPRCAGCGLVVDDLDSFCPDCWRQLDFLGAGGCATCGLPLEGTEAETCGACLASAPRLRRTRAAVAYDDISRGLAMRLKYGRKVALARTMARFMAPLVETDDREPLLVPVPLHRSRLWWRGFNQSTLIARALSRRTGLAVDDRALTRAKRTPSLRGLNAGQRHKAVRGAFRPSPERFRGRRVILVDDVLTTGSTAEACAHALLRSGAESVELISFARVVRPRLLNR